MSISTPEQTEIMAARIVQDADFAALEGRSRVSFDTDDHTGTPVVIKPELLIVNGKLVEGETVSDLGDWVCEMASKDGFVDQGVDVIELSHAIARQIRTRDSENKDPVNG